MEHKNWQGFKGGDWKVNVNVRDFIQNNYSEYKGDESFLESNPTERTAYLMDKVE